MDDPIGPPVIQNDPNLTLPVWSNLTAKFNPYENNWCYAIFWKASNGDLFEEWFNQCELELFQSRLELLRADYTNIFICGKIIISQSY